ncbi:hypothetical protein GCM10027294_53810 [Marinactinospora endophytica]
MFIGCPVFAGGFPLVFAAPSRREPYPFPDVPGCAGPSHPFTDVPDPLTRSRPSVRDEFDRENGAAVMWDEKFENTLRESLPFLAPDEELREDMSLMGAGLDSMGIVQLLSRLEDAYDVRFRDEALTLETFETPGTLWKVLTGLR